MSDFLFANPDFESGFARVLDLGGTFDSYNESPTPKEADCRALFNDWFMIGKDIKSAIEVYKNEQEEKVA